MDGLPFLPRPDFTPVSTAMVRQRTLKAPIACTGVGVHSGAVVNVRLVPSMADRGILFHRIDLGLVIPARFDAVVDTRMCTVLGTADARVGTVEHLMAALCAAGIDNVVVELDGPELPVLDGSAEPWLFLLDCAGSVVVDSPRAGIEVLRPVRVEDGDAFAELRPHRNAAASGLEMALSIAFDASAIGRQALSFSMDALAFRRDLARARTFALKHEIDGLQRAGLARGGSLQNAVVVDGDRVINPAGLRMPDEFVRHKMLDAVGDLALAPAPLHGRFLGHKSGHSLNNRVLHALFADPANWRMRPTADALLAA